MATAWSWVLIALLGGAAIGWLLRGLRRPRGDQPAAPSSLSAPAMAVIAESVPDAIVFFSEAGTIRYANVAARELFFEGTDPVGQNFVRLVSSAPPPLREALLSHSDQLFSVDLEGRPETYHLSRRVFEMDGELYTLLAVKHLTREISRREVELLKRVVRVISHEVNNSLAPVTSLIHSARKIAEQPEPADKLRRVFSTIEERTTHLGTFLNGYATLARLPLPKQKEVEWEGFLSQVLSLYPKLEKPSIPEKHGYFDPVQVEQVVINLIKNAYEAEGEAEKVELEVEVGRDGATVITVSDRGPGFSPDALKNALLPLYTTKEHGSGMGLALSREIAEAHGGSLGVQNREEGGARVRILLPGAPGRGTPDLSRSRLTLTHA